MRKVVFFVCSALLFFAPFYSHEKKGESPHSRKRHPQFGCRLCVTLTFLLLYLGFSLLLSFLPKRKK
ncbi:MAG: hypothetical protein J6J21_01350, partial [Clostridia bacterium]|nr:hypothetical protein [Clostridia bacterium]